MKKLFLLLLAVLSFSLSVSAQTRTLYGTVLDASDDSPIIGASVQPVGLQGGVMTDANGNFRVSVPSSVKEITVSYVGMASQTVPATDGEIVVVLKPNVSELSDLVVVGYTTKKLGAVSGSVAVIDDATFENIPTPSFVDALQGKVAGLDVFSSSGDPMSDHNNITIRGTNSINLGNTPLFILDGAPVSSTVFNSLNPNDIASVTVLKDAASVAIYGSRATNGVIIITTKRGNFDEDAVTTIRASYGWSQMASDNMKMMNAEQYIKFSELIGNKVPDDAYDLVYNYGVNTNWVNETFAAAAPTYNVEANVRGGGQKVSYYASLSYLDQDGIICQSEMNRTNLRTSIDAKPNKWLRLAFQTNLAYARFNTNINNNSVYSGGNLYLANPVMFARMARPYDSAYYWTRNAQGGITFGEKAQRVLWSGLWTPEAYTIYNQPKRDRLTANINLEEAITPIQGLTVRFRQAYDGYENRIRQHYYPHNPNVETPFGTFQLGSDDLGFTAYSMSRYYAFTYTQTAEYHRTFGKHNITALIGEESIVKKSEGFGVSTDGQTDARQMLLTQGTNVTISDVSNAIDHQTLNSFFVVASYDFGSRYFLDANFRRDASTVFAPEHRWSNFWSLGGTWNLKNESFLANKEKINDLRLRLSYGLNGNSSLPGSFLWMGTVGSYSNPYNGVSGLGVANAPNHDLTWETTEGWDAGVSTRFFNRLSAEVDFYHKRTKDMILSIPYSMTTGVSGQYGNIGDMTNIGVDVSASADIVTTKDWYFGVNANFNYNRNRIVKLFDGLDTYPLPDYGLCYKVGHDCNEFWMVRYAGVNPDNGNPQWYDYEGNITEEYNEERDAVLVGKSSHAPWTGGFGLNLRYRNVSISSNFAWAGEKYMINNDRYFLENPASDFAGSYNQTTDMFNIWTHPGQITDIPRYGSQIQFDTHLLENASYMRLKNLTVMYTLPQTVCEKLGLKGLNFHFTGRNLWTVTGFRGFDPEPGSNLVKFNYPNTRQYELGFEVSF